MVRSHQRQCPLPLLRSLLSLFQPSYQRYILRQCLRGDMRVYYDVLEESQTVLVAAVGMKHGNRVFVGGIERQL